MDGAILNRSRSEGAAVKGVLAIGGTADERDLAAIDLGITAATRAVGWQLPSKPITKKEVASLLRCLDPGEPWECIPPTLTAQGIHHALVVAAKKQQGEDGSPVVVFLVRNSIDGDHRNQSIVIGGSANRGDPLWGDQGAGRLDARVSVGRRRGEDGPASASRRSAMPTERLSMRRTREILGAGNG